ncbi:MAG TPA: tRNA (adenosine(37)-N6)-dimethylallyltransferase MiaA [candidate division Zixibacteria bacterium]|nr:tRNA (adenosine(37)-N6)-dimethylallyltransferase MiaA [candidate division Zixibacteria bacterium]
MTLKRYSEENNTIRAVIICGPTGSGKSSWAMELADRYGGRIIGADSRQIYRRFDIGTAKPSREDRAKIPHYLIDVADITEDFTAKKYAEMASTAVVETAAAGAVPFIVGGAGLYLEALTGGLFEGPEKDSSFRDELELVAKQEGPQKLHEELSRVDPETALKISPNDSIRLVRALEVYHLTGKPISIMKAGGEYRRLDAAFLWLGLEFERQELYNRIDARVDRMIEDGLVDEVRELYRDGLGMPIIKKRIVGYYEIVEAIENRIQINKAIARIKQHSRNYAKRQLTWFRNRVQVNWIDSSNSGSSSITHPLIGQHLNKRA